MSLLVAPQTAVKRSRGPVARDAPPPPCSAAGNGPVLWHVTPPTVLSTTVNGRGVLWHVTPPPPPPAGPIGSRSRGRWVLPPASSVGEGLRAPPPLSHSRPQSLLRSRGAQPATPVQASFLDAPPRATRVCATQEKCSALFLNQRWYKHLTLIPLARDRSTLQKVKTIEKQKLVFSCSLMQKA